jgi:predicted phosphodiesterase
MKYCVFGDIHANLEALDAVLNDAAARNCSHFICLGDLVGYNANPSECVEIVRNMGCPVVKGNHDEEASSTRDLAGLNPLAQNALIWTRNQLSAEQKTWLRDLKLVRQVRDFTIVHATLDSPSSWAYVMNKFDAQASFAYQYSQLCFHGHTHHPRIYEKTEGVQLLQKDTIRLNKAVKYLINVGSVGQPRDGDWRAAYATFDLATHEVSIHRVEYDCKAAQKKILDAGLPEMLENRLGVGK